MDRPSGIQKPTLLGHSPPASQAGRRVGSASVFTNAHSIFFRASGGEGGWTTWLPWLSGGALSAASIPGGPPCWASPLAFGLIVHNRVSFQSEWWRGGMDDVPALVERGSAVRRRLCPRRAAVLGQPSAAHCSQRHIFQSDGGGGDGRRACPG
jgi:hypothetical protein